MMAPMSARETKGSGDEDCTLKSIDGDDQRMGEAEGVKDSGMPAAERFAKGMSRECKSECVVKEKLLDWTSVCVDVLEICLFYPCVVTF